MARKFSVGQRVWEFDENYRVYAKAKPGCFFGPPIFDKHFRERRVARIEGQSYLIEAVGPHGAKLAKKIGFAKAEKTYYTDDEKADAVYVDAHRFAISDLVRRADAATLRKVAEIIGYEATQEDQ